MRGLHIFILILAAMLLPFSAYALKPSEVAVVCNELVGDSTKLAEYYMNVRGIPEKNLISIRSRAGERCSRDEYEENIAEPIRRALEERFQTGEIKALAVMYGIPLKINPAKQTEGEKKLHERLSREKDDLREQVGNSSDQAEKARLKERLKSVKRNLEGLDKRNTIAAVDSELALLLVGDYPLANYLPNPFFVGYQGTTQKFLFTKESVLLVSRLDAPSADLVKRIIDDSLAAEKNGLDGKAYFDARYPRPKSTDVTGTAFYDLSIHLAAKRVRESTRLPVVVDQEDAVFQPGTAPEAALYCGWYSLGRYVDAFDWQPGAVGIHIASQECQTLKSGGGKNWCKMMLADGAAAVVGPVGEPYLQSFPVPEAFFRFLIDGFYTLSESYFLSLPWVSWKMVLVGDPLYRPFRNKK